MLWHQINEARLIGFNMNWENAAYAILGLLGIALGLWWLIDGIEGSGGDELTMAGGFLMFVGFYCLNTIKKKDED